MKEKKSRGNRYLRAYQWDWEGGAKWRWKAPLGHRYRFRGKKKAERVKEGGPAGKTT